MFTRSSTAVLALSGVLLSPGACNGDAERREVATSPATADEGDWVSVSGQVVATTPDTLTLDYGAGIITVEMDDWDWDWYREGYSLLLGHDVIVYGHIDNDFFEKRSIDARSVYAEDLGTQYFDTGIDDQDFTSPTVVDSDARVELSGRVTSVSGREFQLDTGQGVIDVNTESMLYNPLDDEGYQKIRQGDRVRVTGEIGYELFADRNLMAETVVTLRSNPGTAGTPGTPGTSDTTADR